MMQDAPKKTSRHKTLARLEEVSDRAVGKDTALDQAFRAFETTDASDTEAMAKAQAILRQLLARGLK